MKIVDFEVSLKNMQLSRPYKICNKSFDEATNVIVKLKLANGIYGFGAGSSSEIVTGETMADCYAALAEDKISWLLGQSIYSLPAHCNYIANHFQATPAAAAALDIALHDAYAKLCELPLVDILGRCHVSLPTSITIGIKSIEESIQEALEYSDRGFKIVKVKLGEQVEKDVALLQALKEACPKEMKIRIDINQGYTLEELLFFLNKTSQFHLELFEQPLSKADMYKLKNLPLHVRDLIAADESLLSPKDALNLLIPEKLCGIFNIKLMKCGGIYAASQIAQIAQASDTALMWGCMDESIISIAAALHIALACPTTRYLDLDGSLDLMKDVVSGGFILENGCLRTVDQPGLGCVPLE